jgi:hypothetical protein
MPRQSSKQQIGAHQSWQAKAQDHYERNPGSYFLDLVWRHVLPICCSMVYCGLWKFEEGFPPHTISIDEISKFIQFKACQK